MNIDQFVDKEEISELVLKNDNKEFIILLKETTFEESIEMIFLPNEKKEKINELISHQIIKNVVGWKNVLVKDVLKKETQENLIKENLIKEEDLLKDAEFSKKAFDRFIMINNFTQDFLLAFNKSQAKKN